jgi:hypothetical protein
MVDEPEELLLNNRPGNSRVAFVIFAQLEFTAKAY